MAVIVTVQTLAFPLSVLQLWSFCDIRLRGLIPRALCFNLTHSPRKL